MGSMLISIAAATAVAGYDLAQGQVGQQQSEDRMLTGIAVSGSAAAGDTVIRLQVDQVEVGKFWNTSLAFPTIDVDLMDLDDIGVPGNSQIHLIVEDPPATNPINILLNWEEI